MTDIESIALVFGETNDIESQVFKSSLKLAVYESQDTYAERFPYAIAKTLTGDRYVWTVEFIEKILYAMSTDDLSDMSHVEYEIMMAFIDYQDRHSTIPSQTQIASGAIGCTILNELGVSYVVYNSGVSTQVCLDAPSDVPRASMYDSLDSVLINILNCEDWQNDGIKTGTLYSVSECQI